MSAEAFVSRETQETVRPGFGEVPPTDAFRATTQNISTKSDDWLRIFPPSLDHRATQVCLVSSET